MDGKPRAGRRLPRMRWDLAAVAVAFAAPIAVLVLGDGDRPAGLTIDRSSAQASAAGGGGGAVDGLTGVVQAPQQAEERVVGDDERAARDVGLGVANGVRALELGDRLLHRGAGTRAHELHPRHCLLYTSPSPRDRQKSRMPSSA